MHIASNSIFYSCQASSRGWVAERSYFSQALTNELQRRGVDISIVCKDNAIRYIPVCYDCVTHSLMAIG